MLPIPNLPSKKKEEEWRDREREYERDAHTHRKRDMVQNIKIYELRYPTSSVHN